MQHTGDLRTGVGLNTMRCDSPVHKRARIWGDTGVWGWGKGFPFGFWDTAHGSHGAIACRDHLDVMGLGQTGRGLATSIHL